MRTIDADALKEQVKELLDLAVKRVDDIPNNSPCYLMYVAQENERARLIDLINNAPTINLNKRSFIEGYKEGCEFGKKCYERPQGEWNEIQAGMFACPFCGARPHNDFKNFCPNCGADMRNEQRFNQP